MGILIKVYLYYFKTYCGKDSSDYRKEKLLPLLKLYYFLFDVSA